MSVCLSASVVRSGDYYLFETDSEEEEEEEKKQEEEKKKKEEELPEKSAFQVRRGAEGCRRPHPNHPEIKRYARDTGVKVSPLTRCLSDCTCLSVCVSRLDNRLQNSHESSK